MNKILLLIFTMLTYTLSFAGNCDQYNNSADKKSCLELNTLINQTEQESKKVYNDAVNKAQANVPKGQLPPTLSKPATPVYQAPQIPSSQQPTQVQQQPATKQEQQTKRTRIYY